MAERDAERGNWGNWLEFLFSTIGCLVGLGNVWRFPYVCYTNGGGAFLIPYLVAMVVCGVPMFFLELAVCQFSNLGPGRVWVICPLFRGLGYGMVVLTSVVALYYNVIIAWALYYVASSFSSVLPWSTCGNEWNDDACIPSGFNNDVIGNATVYDVIHNATSYDAIRNTTSYDVISNATRYGISATPREVMLANLTLTRVFSVEQFWTRHVLQESDSIEHLGAIRWQLLLCLLATWVIIFFCLFKDIKTSGKVVYVAAVLPYVVLLALLIRGALLPGAMDGIKFFLVPQWHRLLDWQVWLAASSQVFYSAGIAWGGVATLASFNKFHNNCYRDAILLPILDAVTSVFAGFVIFVFLGYMAHVKKTTVDKVISQGTSLAFIAYPDALATMPLPQLWAVLFFLVLFTVGLDSQFVHVQTVTSAIADSAPNLFVKRKRWVTLGICVVGMLLGVPFVTQGGLYVLTLCDHYVATISVMLLAVLECLLLAWVYGSQRLYDDIALMIGYRPNPMWHVLWRVVSPAFVLSTWVLGMVGWGHLPTYPEWSQYVGILIAVLPLLPVPVTASVQLAFLSSGTFLQRLRASLRPGPEWKPALSHTAMDQGLELEAQHLKPGFVTQ